MRVCSEACRLVSGTAAISHQPKFQEGPRVARGLEGQRGVVFADDLGAWLVGTLADTARKRLWLEPR